MFSDFSLHQSQLCDPIPRTIPRNIPKSRSRSRSPRHRSPAVSTATSKQQDEVEFTDVIAEMVRLRPSSMGAIIAPKEKINGPWSTKKSRSQSAKTQSKLVWTPQMREVATMIEDRMKSVPADRSFSIRHSWVGVAIPSLTALAQARRLSLSITRPMTWVFPM